MNTPALTIKLQEAINLNLGLSRFPSAGPHPNITGMKNLYWGKDALVIKCGVYAYSVDAETYAAARDGREMQPHEHRQFFCE